MNSAVILHDADGVSRHQCALKPSGKTMGLYSPLVSLTVSYLAQVPFPRKSTSIVTEAAFSAMRCSTFLSKPVKRKGSEGLPAVTMSLRHGPPQPCGLPQLHRSSVLPNQTPLCGWPR